MARRRYSTKDFFRHIPNTLLARYFQDRELFADLDFTAMKESKPNALFDAWLELDEKQRNPMDAQFREIFDVSCQKGFQAIIDEARWQLRGTPEEIPPFVDMLATLPSHYETSA